MRMKTKLICVALAIIAFASCTPQDAVYKDLYHNAYKVDYPQAPAQLSGMAGYLSAYLKWLAPVSPTCTEAIIYWNIKQDSLRVNLRDPKYNHKDTICVKIAGLEETDYTFDVYTIDRVGSRSIMSEALVSPKGPNYVKTLVARPVNNAVVSEINEAGVVNLGNRNKVSPYSEIRYKDSFNIEKTIRVKPSENKIVLKDIDIENPEDIEYRSAFVTADCIDTLYSEWTRIGWFVDPDYAKNLPADVTSIGFTLRKNGTVTQDAKDPNKYLFSCQPTLSVNVNPLTEPLTKSVLVYQYKQTEPSTNMKVYWIDKGGSASSSRSTTIDLKNHAYGTDEWNVAVIDLADYWTTHAWMGNVGDKARFDFTTTDGNQITVRNAHFRDKRDGE